MTDNNKIINRVSFVTIAGNFLLTVFKFFAGFAGSSGAMMSDAIHTLSDVLTTAIAWLGTRLSARKADRLHPYGHERLECVASLLLGFILLITALSIGMTGITVIATGQRNEPPTAIALVAAIISIFSKEIMYWYTRYYAKKINSTAFMADAWHHRSDALSSIGALIGIGGAMLGVPAMDAIAGIVICLCILKVSYDVLADALRKMLDTACPEENENEIRALILSNPDVIRLDRFRTRLFGNRIYVDAEVYVDRTLSLEQACAITSLVHDTVEQNFANVKHIMIHVNPA